MVADDDEDDFESIIEIVYNEVMQHPSIKFDELVADHLKLETHYLVNPRILLNIFCDIYMLVRK